MTGVWFVLSNMIFVYLKIFVNALEVRTMFDVIVEKRKAMSKLFFTNVNHFRLVKQIRTHAV